MKARAPNEAPGEAGRPTVSGEAFFLAAGSNEGSSNWVRSLAGIRFTAVFSVISFSLTMSQAIFTAAAPVRLPFRVCSMNSLPRSMVNSMSCTSL